MINQYVMSCVRYVCIRLHKEVKGQYLFESLRPHLASNLQKIKWLEFRKGSFGRLWLFASGFWPLLLVCCHLWWFVVICWWFVFACWWFVVITCFSNYGLKLCTLDGATLYLPVLRNYLRILKYFLSHITHCLVHLPASYFPVVTSALFFTQNYLVSFQDSLRFWKTFP